ncbi:hypothetical protein PFISCL1PPCAC_27928, partial [Pristionchus fissidentatus]
EKHRITVERSRSGQTAPRSGLDIAHLSSARWLGRPVGSASCALGGRRDGDADGSGTVAAPIVRPVPVARHGTDGLKQRHRREIRVKEDEGRNDQIVDILEMNNFSSRDARNFASGNVKILEDRGEFVSKSCLEFLDFVNVDFFEFLVVFDLPLLRPLHHFIELVFVVWRTEEFCEELINGFSRKALLQHSLTELGLVSLQNSEEDGVFLGESDHWGDYCGGRHSRFERKGKANGEK